MALRFSLIVVAVGAAVTVLPFFDYLLDVPPDELRVELRDKGVGLLFLVSPYLGLAVLGRRARPVVGYGALALLMLGSLVYLIGAGSDPQGGLVALYILPLQWLTAILAAASRSSAPPRRDPRRY